MQFYLLLAIVVLFCQVETLSKNGALQKAFVKISKVLSQQDNFVSIVVGSDESDITDSSPFLAIASTPHVVARFENGYKMLRIKSSAIVTMDSIATLEIFNARTILPVAYSM